MANPNVDGSFVVGVEFDDKEAMKELNQLKREIKSLEKSIEDQAFPARRRNERICRAARQSEDEAGRAEIFAEAGRSNPFQRRHRAI